MGPVNYTVTFKNRAVTAALRVKGSLMGTCHPGGRGHGAGTSKFIFVGMGSRMERARIAAWMADVAQGP